MRTWTHAVNICPRLAKCSTQGALLYGTLLNTHTHAAVREHVGRVSRGGCVHGTTAYHVALSTLALYLVEVAIACAQPSSARVENADFTLRSDKEHAGCGAPCWRRQRCRKTPSCRPCPICGRRGISEISLRGFLPHSIFLFAQIHWAVKLVMTWAVRKAHMLSAPVNPGNSILMLDPAAFFHTFLSTAFAPDLKRKISC
jgi:hypothetical protein